MSTEVGRRFDRLLARPELTETERGLLGEIRFLLSMFVSCATTRERELAEYRDLFGGLISEEELDGEKAARLAHREVMTGLLQGTVWRSDDPVNGHGVCLATVRAFEDLANRFPYFVARTSGGYSIYDRDGEYHVTVLDALNLPRPLAPMVAKIKADALADSKRERRRNRLN